MWDVTVVQVWLMIGVPTIAVALILFTGRNRWRSAAGYAVLAAGFGGMAVFDRASAVLLGAALALLYASGRGGAADRGPDPMSQTGVAAAEAAGPDEMP